MRSLCSLALILLLNQACASSSTGVSVFHRFDELDMSREFSSQTISSKSFVVNVIGLDKFASSREPSLTATQATNLLIEEFHRLRPELNPQEPRLTAAEKKSLAQVLERFAERQEFPADGYNVLQKSSLATSWFLIADVERADTEREIKEEDIKDVKGRTVDTKYSFISTRKLDVRYFIYDPTVRHLVFSGLVRTTTQATQDRIGGGDERDYPEAPSLAKSMNENFEKFLRALPATRGQ
jgi:hypothetical protein